MRTALASLLLAVVLVLDGCGDTPVTPTDAPLDVAVGCSGDGDCDDGTFCGGTGSCVAGHCVVRPACEDGQICDEPNARCFTACAVSDDADGDGAVAVECGGLDCDDNDRERSPASTEICDTAMRDEDCDATTYGVRDADGDDAPDARCCNLDPVSGEPRCGNDCDDTRAGVGPRVAEVCNGIDDDCDALTDEGLLAHVYLDADRDGHGIADPATGEEMDTCDVEPGWARSSDDCDDLDADRFPGNPEICDVAMLDEDCTGVGNDVPGGCACTGTISESCGTTGVCMGAMRTCDGAGTWGPCSAVAGTEVCDGENDDEDCDGSVDEDLRVPCYTDTDRDGYARDGTALSMQCRSSDTGRAAAPWNGCPLGFTGRAPSGAGSIDCCDGDGHVRPGAGYSATPSACAGSFDLDCNGTVERDHGTAMHTCSTTCSGEGWCDPAPACGATAGYTTGCWRPGGGSNPCYAVSCWPTTMACR